MLFLNTSLSLTSFKLNRYNPYINYSWSTKTVGTSRKLTDLGTANLDADMFTGRAMYFDSALAQTSILNINATIQTIYYFNGTNHVYAEGSQTLTTYTLNDSKQYSNLIFYNGIFTASQKLALENTPEEFLYYDEARNKYSNVLNASELSKVVAHFPMTDTDGFIRDNAGYSLGTKNLVVSQTFGVGNTIQETGVDTFLITNITTTGQFYYPIFRIAPSSFDDSIYAVRFIIKILSGSALLSRLEGAKSKKYDKVLNSGQEFEDTNIMSFNNIGGQKGALLFNGAEYSNFVAEVYITATKISGIYPITNYTSSMNKTVLNTGLQTGKLKLDSNGLIIGKSDYLEFYDKESYTASNDVQLASQHITIELVYKSPSILLSYNKILSWGNHSPFGIRIERLGDKETMYFIIGQTGSPNQNLGVLPMVSDSASHYVYTIDFEALLAKRYLNGLLIGAVSIASSEQMQGIYKLLLNNNLTFNRGNLGQMRMVKIHTLPFTQEEVTKNYNDAVSKGLIL